MHTVQAIISLFQTLMFSLGILFHGFGFRLIEIDRLIDRHSGEQKCKLSHRSHQIVMQMHRLEIEHTRTPLHTQFEAIAYTI